MNDVYLGFGEIAVCPVFGIGKIIMCSFDLSNCIFRFACLFFI